MNKCEFIEAKNNHTCNKCKTSFIFMPDEIWWDDSGYGYSTKLVKCPYCGVINVVNHSEDYWLDVNYDKRFYK